MSARKRGLGRGLDALLGNESEENARTLPVQRLQPNRFQPRTDFDEESLRELADSIRSQGLVQPIVVTPAAGGAYTIVAGERRWRAARQAGLDAVPVVVREVAGDRELLELALVENLQRSDLNPMEEAEAYRSLREKFELSQEEIAARVGKSRPAVSNSLRLLRLAAEVRELLRAGRLSAGQARPLLALEEPRQVELARRAVEKGLSARDMERLAAEPRRVETTKKKTQPPRDVHTVAAEEKLTRRLQTKVEIQRRRKGGLLRIHFHSEEELMRLYDLMMEGEGGE